LLNVVNELLPPRSAHFQHHPSFCFPPDLLLRCSQQKACVPTEPPLVLLHRRPHTTQHKTISCYVGLSGYWEGLTSLSSCTKPIAKAPARRQCRPV